MIIALFMMTRFSTAAVEELMDVLGQLEREFNDPYSHF